MNVICCTKMVGIAIPNLNFKRPICDDPTNSLCIKIRVHVRACVPLVDIYNSRSYDWSINDEWMLVHRQRKLKLQKRLIFIRLGISFRL